jgi:hypothetical protein
MMGKGEIQRAKNDNSQLLRSNYSRLYDKNSESDNFFFLHQNKNIFLEKNHNPVQVKWSFPYYIRSLTIHHIGYHNTHTGTSLIYIITGNYQL